MLSSMATKPSFLTYSDDGTARLWDAETGEPAGQPMRHQGTDHRWPSSTKTKTWVVTYSDDRTIRLWDISDFRAGKEDAQPKLRC